MSDGTDAAPLRVVAWPGPAADGGNPYPRLLAEALARAGHDVAEWSPAALRDGDWDVWHLHWPEHVLRLPATRAAVSGLLRLVRSLARARRAGVTVVWTVHNLHGHDPAHPFLERVLRALVARSVDGWLSLSAAAVPTIEGAIPALKKRPHAVVPHGHYRDVHDEPTIEPGADRVLFLGAIRRYKGVVELVRAFHGLDRDATLRICGEPEDGALATEIRTTAAGDERIQLALERVPDDRITTEYAAASLVALPFRHVLNSGSVLLALSMDRPVLVPRTPVLEELRTEVGDRWVRCYEGELDASVLADALDWARGAAGNRAPLDHHDWTHVAERTAAAYRSFAGAQHG